MVGLDRAPSRQEGCRARTRGIARRLLRAADGPHPPSRRHQRIPLGPHREQPDPLAHGGRAQPQHHRLGRPHLRRLRVQLSLGSDDRPGPAAVALPVARAAPRLDPRPAGRDPGVPRTLERAGPLGKSGLRRRHRPRHRRRVRDPGHRRRRAQNRADGEDRGRGDGRRRGGRGGRLVERVQARRHRGARNRRGLPDRGRRKLLAGDLPRARDRGRSLQRRPPLRARGRSGGAHGRPDRGRGADRRAPAHVRPLGACPPPGWPAPSSAR